MLQSGTANFISSNVVNLDGKVNADALHAKLHGQLGAYIVEQRFDYLADWQPFVKDIAGQAGQFGATYDSSFWIGRVLWMRRVN
jgi:hypothetical protein